MPFSLFLTTLHHLLVVALKRKNLATFQILILHNVLKTKSDQGITCLSLAIQLGFPLLGADDGLLLQPNLSSPALLDSQESVGL